MVKDCEQALTLSSVHSWGVGNDHSGCFGFSYWVCCGRPTAQDHYCVSKNCSIKSRCFSTPSSCSTSTSSLCTLVCDQFSLAVVFTLLCGEAEQSGSYILSASCIRYAAHVVLRYPGDLCASRFVLVKAGTLYCQSALFSVRASAFHSWSQGLWAGEVTLHFRANS